MCARLASPRTAARDNLLAASSADVSSYAGAKGDDFITDPGNHSPRPPTPTSPYRASLDPFSLHGLHHRAFLTRGVDVT